MTITDIDIDSIELFVFNPDLVPDEAEQEAERLQLLSYKNNLINRETGELMTHEDPFFAIHIESELRRKSRENLARVEETDSTKETLYKHYVSMKGARYNIESFNEKLTGELKSED